MKKKLVFLLLFCMAYSSFAVKLFGKVYNDSTLEPISGAKIESHGVKAESDSKGYYYFNNFDYGMLIIEVRANGYIPYTTTISLDDKRVRFDVPLRQSNPIDTSKILHRKSSSSISIPEVKRPVPPVVKSVKSVKKVNNNKDISKINIEPQKSNKKDENSDNTKDLSSKGVSIEFIHAKKMLENGDFVNALPLFYEVSQFGQSELSMQSDYYISIIYRTQKLYLLEIDYLLRTMSKAFRYAEKLSFVNQVRSDLALAYMKSGRSATAKIIAQKVLNDQAKNFPLTNFNCLQLMATLKKNDGKFDQAFSYYESALKINVKPQLKNSVYLKVIDFHMQREEFSKAKRLLTELSNNFQSSQTEKRKILISALELYQSELRAGNTSNISKKVIPEINKSLKIDADYTLALSYLANIDFLIGKLENNLQLVTESKRVAEHLNKIDPGFRDQSGKTSAELVTEINSFLKNY